MSVQSEHDIFSFRANYAFAKWKAANIEDAKRSDNYKKSFDELRYVLQSHVTVPSKAHPVCIIGAGPAGLYTAMILQSLGIPYRLLEASGRVGGRLLTHRFGPRAGEWPNMDIKYDYFDAGAMRFPDTPFMRRVFNLVRDNPHEGTTRKVDVKLIPYNFKDENTFVFFNNNRYTRSQTLPEDPFRVRPWVQVPEGGLVPEAVNERIDEVLHEFRAPFAQPSANLASLVNDLILKADAYSLRSWLAFKSEPPTHVSAIDYYEMLSNSTAGFDRGLTDIVLESLAFDWPDKDEGKKRLGVGAGAGPVLSKVQAEIKWYCFDGGSSRLAETMQATLTTRVEFDHPVSKIAELNGKLMEVYVKGQKLDQQFSAVISTVPLPRLGLMDLSECSIHENFTQWSAMRSLQYGPSIKIGIRFSRPWWQDERFGAEGGIKGGQSSTDLPIRTTVYPSYPDGNEKSRVLIVSYCWTQDADRMASFIKGDGKADKQLIDLVFSNLAQLHDVPEKYLRDMYEEGDYFAWSWNQDPNAMGGFALFGPQQFEYLYPQMIQSAAHEKLFFAGEALSTCHAWVAGAFNSSWRAVAHLLETHGNPELRERFRKDWGKSEFWDKPITTTTIDAAQISDIAKGAAAQDVGAVKFVRRDATRMHTEQAKPETVKFGDETAMQILLRIGYTARETQTMRQA